MAVRRERMDMKVRAPDAIDPNMGDLAVGQRAERLDDVAVVLQTAADEVVR